MTDSRPGRDGYLSLIDRFIRIASRTSVLAILSAIALRTGASATGHTGPVESAISAAGEAPAWIQIDYGALVDRRKLSHSGDSVGTLLKRLEGRPAPQPGDRSEDAQAHALLEPLVESYAFVLSDALDSRAPAQDPPMFEVGSLWLPGERQPAWAELLRSRRYVVESDGAGRFRLLLPWEGEETPAAAERAWEKARPLLRHVFAAERRRGGGENHSIQADVFPYRHLPARALFRLGIHPHHVLIDDAALEAGADPLDLQSWQSFLDSGLLLEGARLDPDGRLKLLGSQTATRPGILGRPLSLADFSVAYRAVFYGGASEPYMSLDRGFSPQTSIVNYGGRLQDTGLGLVSLLCDIRFKTFSLGLDILSGKDQRETLRRELPSFRTHLERFASDVRSKGVLGQQTRLWFYPDNVDLTLSEQADVLVLRRVRMSAASERLQQQISDAGRSPASKPAAGELAKPANEEEPPWTGETVAAINRDYERLGTFFPELLDLDQVVRLLSLFTWLKEAGAEGLLLPDLDTLLALELPASPTPRTFPQLLTYNALSAPGGTDPVMVLDRAAVVEALERLAPWSGRPLPALRRLGRASSLLDRRLADHAALSKEIESYDLKALDESDLDILTQRAERLVMHSLVQNALPPSDSEALAGRARSRSGGAPAAGRVLSVGIGGLDLGMGQALARAKKSRRERLQWAVPAASRDSGEGTVSAGSVGPRRSASAPSISSEQPRPVAAGARADSPLLPAVSLPQLGAAVSSPIWARKSAAKTKDTPGWFQVVSGGDGPSVRSRTCVLDRAGRAQTFERVEEMRFIRYRLEMIAPGGSSLRAVPVEDTAPSPTADGPAAPVDEEATAALLPPGLATLHVEESVPAPGNAAESPSVTLRLRGGSAEDLKAPVPRSLLLRMIFGKEVDLTPGTPLRGFSPPPSALGEIAAMMFLTGGGFVQAPWEGPVKPVAGEEDPVRLAWALENWWAAASSATHAVVGTDAVLSPKRWAAAPKIGPPALLLLPGDAFPGISGRHREALAGAWKAGSVSESLPDAQIPTLIVLISSEAPDVFASRLRALARQPALKGKLLAAWSLAGQFREDLPARIIAEGNLAGLGLAVSSPLTLRRAQGDLIALSASIATPTGRPKSAESLGGPFLWFY